MKNGPIDYTVPASRLRGWDGTKNEGDIRNSYSGDRIPEGRIRAPFYFRGLMYVKREVNHAGVPGENPGGAKYGSAEPGIRAKRIGETENERQGTAS